MKILSFSGGATKICALVAHGTNVLKSGYKPDVLVGVSSGSLVMLPLLLGKYEMLKEITTNLKLSDIFDKMPVNEKGKIPFKAFVRSVFTGSLGSMNNLKYMIEYFVSKKEFEDFCKNENSPILYAGITNMNTNEFHLKKLNNLTYEAFIEVLIASCSIPVYTPPIKIGKELYYDGGLIHHNAAIRYLKKNHENITECISVYTREKNANEYDPKYNGKSLGRNLSKSVDFLQKAISIHDASAEKLFCKSKKIKLTQLFSPKVLKGVYDVNPERLKKLYDLVIKK